VRGEIVRGLAPGLVVGTLAGTTLASLIPTRPLAVIFVCIVYYASAQMMLDFKPKPHRQMPGKTGMLAAGGLIGVLSSQVSAGGGFMSIPFMVFCNVAIHQAVGTSATLGFPSRQRRLPRRRLEHRRPAGLVTRLCLSAGSGRRGGDDHAHRAARREDGTPAAGEAVEARLRRLPRPPGDEDAARPPGLIRA
jgi:hypothetical protein